MGKYRKCSLKLSSVAAPRQHGTRVLVSPVAAVVVSVTLKLFANAFLVLALKLILTAAQEVHR